MKDNRFTAAFATAHAEFDGLYANELSQLKGLSSAEIKAITPDTTSEQSYKALIDAVEAATKNNLSQAQLVGNIKELGEVAVKIAKKIPGLAAIL